MHRSGLWQIVLLSGTGPTTIVDSGVSPAVHHSGSNQLTIACNADPGTDQTGVAFEVNGIPVANDVVNASSTQWVPSVELCSCSGADTGSFLNAAYYSISGSPPAASPT